ncbi:N,N'-diacetyllegionaminate synthase [Anseongella ginsenosidimutans]|uniref:N,N'-diacetyllegionaminate synthase n=1 Tax=Anseongella ginsenosidimutans TaxID=496056 RepID=A0A4V2UT93_9SPHI|nr:N-acetylneuraminate synthase family protein [Anseongella ginsenosidimutans]QEC52137.1 N-acetylneuraminate synthase [Anseongella ginsenosidimutans]TCS84834.1 N,N'-diacetyllegionaminate synthase [Anseongella ginsenosidimutans]
MLPSNKPYLIGETAFHHQGDELFLRELIDHGANAKANAIKFHLLLDLDDYMIKTHDAYHILQEWMLTESQWENVIAYNSEKGLDSILLCNDLKSIEFAVKLESDSLKAIELHATGLNDYFLLKKASEFDKTVILGIGGSSIDEISYAIEMLKSLGKDDIFLMYGFQNYPTRYENINLKKMIKLQNLFALPVGYADHTDPSDEFNEIVSILGIPMGINVCEKHFTHVFGEKRIDSQSAVSMEQFAKIRKMMDAAWTAAGDGILKMSEAELSYGNTGPMKKAIVASTPIKKGEIITLAKIAFKRTNESTYILQKFLPQLLGAIASKDIEQDEFIDFANVIYKFQKTDFGQFSANK